ncbi:MAG: hypothetical protein ACLFVE_00555 [Chitinispirillaceae bacterium]
MKRIIMIAVVLGCMSKQSFSQESSVNVSVLKNDLVYTSMPEVHGSNVLIQDFKDGYFKFYTVDVQTGTETEIRQHTEYIYPMAFSGKYVAWIECDIEVVRGMTMDTSVQYHVKAMNVDDRTEHLLSTDTLYKEHIAAYGDKVVWTDYRHTVPGDTTVEIYMYDFSRMKESRITEVQGYKAWPHIYKNKIVWQDYRHAETDRNADIFMRDLDSEIETEVCTEGSYQAQPHIWEDKVVWQDYRNAVTEADNADIFMRDLSTGALKEICTVSGYQGTPKIYGNLIVWHDYRNARQDSSNADIYMYDLSEDAEYPVSLNDGYEGEPELWGNTVVWQDYSDLFLYKGIIEEVSSAIVPCYNPSSAEPNASCFYDLTGRKIPRSGIRNKIILKKDPSGLIDRSGVIR